jgi:hypothetical protein
LTPAMIAKESASGISAKATVIPDKISPLTLQNHDSRMVMKFILPPCIPLKDNLSFDIL